MEDVVFKPTTVGRNKVQMSDLSARKRPPERLCPRGVKDTDFSGSDWTHPRRPCDSTKSSGRDAFGREFTLYLKRAANFLVDGDSLRSPQENLVAAS